MLDLEAMRARSRQNVERKPFKTNLTPDAMARLQAASEYTGLYIYEIVEELVSTGLPESAQIDQ
jgi:hypothetical protein